MLLLDGSCIENQIFHHLPVHEGLASEEVDFKISSGSGVLNKEIQSALAGFEAHEGSLTGILSLTCEAVFTVEIAAVSHVKAESLYDSLGSFLEFIA